MSVFQEILSELFTCKLHRSLHRYCPPSVLCKSVYTIIGPASPLKVHLLPNLSMKIKPDFTDSLLIKRGDLGLIANKI